MFSISGINSGLEINAILDAIVQSEEAPTKNRIKRAESDYTVKLSALGKLQEVLTAFSKSVDELNDRTAFTARQTLVSDSSLLSASSNDKAATGSYRIRIDQLATNHAIASNGFSETDTFGTGDLVINLGSDSMTLSLNSENNTLSAIRDGINSASNNPGISATLINDGASRHLLLTSEKSGQSQVLSLDGSALSLTAEDRDLTADTLELTAAKDARVTLGEGDGQLSISHPDNRLEGVIDGLNIDLLATSSDFQTITVNQDQEDARTRIENFVTAYNALLGEIKTLTRVKEGEDPGPLVGDPQIRSLQNQIRTSLSRSYTSDSISLLANFGITTSAQTGTLSIDKDVLDAAVKDNFAQLPGFFSGETALAGSLATILDQYEAAGGIIRTRIQTLQNKIRDLRDEKASLEERMSTVRGYWEKKFIAMDNLLGKYNNLGTYLNNMLKQNNSR